MLPYLDKHERIPTYGVLMILAIAVCFLLLLFLEKNGRLKTEDKIYGGSIALVSGLLGAKLLSILTSIDIIIEYRLSVVDIIRNGFVFYGGFLGGLVGIIIYCLAYKIKLTDFFDCVALVLPVGHAIGRIGCFCAGCCFGRPTDSCLGVVYHTSADPNTPLDTKILPTQLFEAAYCLIIFAILFFLNRKQPKSGIITAVYMVLYSIFRFTNEFFRYDESRGFLFGLSTSQLISLLIFISVITLTLIRFFKQRAKPSIE